MSGNGNRKQVALAPDTADLLDQVRAAFMGQLDKTGIPAASNLAPSNGLLIHTALAQLLHALQLADLEQGKAKRRRR